MVNFWRSLRFTLVFAIILGLLYPLVVTGIGSALFPSKARGSIINIHGHPVGSTLIAQNITNPGLFHPRPSAVNYAANGSGGSNLGPTNPALLAEVRKNLQTVERQNPGTSPSVIPTDMIESSGSGLDPDISIQDALVQVPRVAKASGLTQASIKSLIDKYEQKPILGIWGEPMVDVMTLNMAILKAEK